MLKRIHLHGSLKEIHPDPIEVHADTVIEAIKAVTMQLPGFRPNAVDGRKRISVVDFETVESLFAYTDKVDIHIVPQFCGGKKGGFLQIIIGAVLIAASFLLAATPLAFLSPLLLKTGALLIIGGLLQLIAAPKRDQKDGEQNRSHYLGAPKNTVAIGTRIGILYGRGRIGGHYLSFNLASMDVGLAPAQQMPNTILKPIIDAIA